MWRPILLFFLFNYRELHAQRCRNTFFEYLNCIDSSADRSYAALERELVSDFKSEVSRCFTSNTNQDLETAQKCSFNPSDFDKDVFGREGPLAPCPTCLKVAKFIKKIFFEADAKSLTCLRRVIRGAIKDETEYCIGEKTKKPFKIKSIPDFDRQSSNNRKLVEKTIKSFISPFYELELCQLGAIRGHVNTGAPQFTKNCLENPRKGSYATHCRIMKQCRDRLEDHCQDDFLEIEKHACDCFNEKREEIKKQIRHVPRQINDMVKANRGATLSSLSEKCVNIIGLLLKSKAGVDWKTVINTAITQCLRGQIPRLGRKELDVDTMLELGCKFSLNRFSKGGLRDLAIGTRFLQVVIDSMIARVNRFCAGDHCDLVRG